MRRLVAGGALGLLASLGLATSAGAQAPTYGAPVVVDGAPITRADLVAQAQDSLGGSTAKPTGGALRDAATVVVRARWTTREAALRGIVVPPAAVEAAVAEQRRRDADQPTSATDDPAADGARLAAGIQRELVTAAIAADADAHGGTPAAYRAAFDAADARERAVTRCLPGTTDPRQDLCGDARRTTAPCLVVGLEPICSYVSGGRRAWGLQPDLITAFEDPPQAAEAAVTPDGDRALARLRRYLRVHAPGPAHRCPFDADDLAYVTCPTRLDAVAIARAVWRIHATATRTWTVPATAGVL